MSYAGRPFTQRVVALRQTKRLTYQGLARGCRNQRSSAWFNTLVNRGGTWGVNPPPQAAFDGLCALLGVAEEELRAMIAEEWFGVTRSAASDRMKEIGMVLDRLSQEDYELVTALARRLPCVAE